MQPDTGRRIGATFWWGREACRNLGAAAGFKTVPGGRENPAKEKKVDRLTLDTRYISVIYDSGIF